MARFHSRREADIIPLTVPESHTVQLERAPLDGLPSWLVTDLLQAPPPVEISTVRLPIAHLLPVHGTDWVRIARGSYGTIAWRQCLAVPGHQLCIPHIARHTAPPTVVPVARKRFHSLLTPTRTREQTVADTIRLQQYCTRCGIPTLALYTDGTSLYSRYLNAPDTIVLSGNNQSSLYRRATVRLRGARVRNSARLQQWQAAIVQRAIDGGILLAPDCFFFVVRYDQDAHAVDVVPLVGDFDNVGVIGAGPLSTCIAHARDHARRHYYRACLANNAAALQQAWNTICVDCDLRIAQ